MTMTDPVSDLLTRIRNASAARHETVDIPSSKLKLEITRILKEEGYISKFILNQDSKQGVIRIQLRYAAGKNPAITSIDRISRPGCRVYTNKDEIPTGARWAGHLHCFHVPRRVYRKEGSRKGIRRGTALFCKLN